jgi:hypothetical protein
MLKWLQPARKKCERLGHNRVVRVYSAYTGEVPVSLHRGVVGRGEVTLTVCKRCRFVLSEPEIDAQEAIQSFSAPSSVVDEIRKRGFYLIEKLSEEEE